MARIPDKPRQLARRIGEARTELGKWIVHRSTAMPRHWPREGAAAERSLAVTHYSAVVTALTSV